MAKKNYIEEDLPEELSEENSTLEVKKPEIEKPLLGAKVLFIGKGRLYLSKNGYGFDIPIGDYVDAKVGDII